jgi:hypothetical protein
VLVQSTTPTREGEGCQENLKTARKRSTRRCPKLLYYTVRLVIKQKPAPRIVRCCLTYLGQKLTPPFVSQLPSKLRSSRHAPNMQNHPMSVLLADASQRSIHAVILSRAESRGAPRARLWHRACTSRSGHVYSLQLRLMSIRLHK